MRSRVLALTVLALLSIAAAQEGNYLDSTRGVLSYKRRNYAVLVDAENSSWRKMKPILEEIAIFGDTTVRRAYGDFYMPELKTWRDVSLELSFRQVNTPCHVPGKGSADAALIIEAMDLLHTNPTLKGFALVSSDSDFTSLAQRLREAGKHLLGFGGRHTPRPFVTSCHQFIYTENIVFGTQTEKLAGGIDTEALAGGTDTENVAGGTAAAVGGQTLPLAGQQNLEQAGGIDTEALADVTDTETPAGGRAPASDGQTASVESSSSESPQLSTDAIKLITRAVEQLADETDGQGWVNLGRVKPLLTQFKPDFDMRSYGFQNMKAGVLSEPRHFEGKVVPGGCYWIRLVGGSSDAGAGGSSAARIVGGSAGKLTPGTIKLVARAVQKLEADGQADDEGWVKLSDLKMCAQRLQKNFHQGAYGFETMTALVKSAPEHFEFQFSRRLGCFARLVRGSSEADSEADA